jgi:hypothetical protein
VQCVLNDCIGVGSVYADPMRAHNLHGLLRLHIAVHEQTDYVTYVSVIATVLKFGQLVHL